MKTVKKENVAIRKQQTDVIDLLEIMHILLKNAHVIAFATFLFGFLALAATFFLITPTYQAQVTLYANNMSSTQSTSVISQGDLNASAQLVNTYSAIIRSESLLEDVIEQADVNTTAESLKRRIGITQVNDSEVFQVSVVDSDPKAAARIANALADIVPNEISQIVEGSSVKVINRAKIPEDIVSPSYGRNTEMGLLFGFVLSAGVLVFLGLMDSSIQTESDLARFDLPVLGSIPDLEGTNTKGSGDYEYGYEYRRHTEAEQG